MATMMDDALFTVEELRQAGIEERLGDTIELVHEPPPANQRHYSLTGMLPVQLTQGGIYQLFFKKHAPQYEKPSSHVDDLSPMTREQRVSRSLHLREYTFLNEIHRKINRTLVPAVLGKLTKPEENIFVLFTEYLAGDSAREEYLKLWQTESGETDARKKEKNRKAKLKQMQTDLKRIAKFVGNCHAQKHNLSNSITEWLEEGYKNIQQMLPSRLQHYLLRAADYQEKQRDPALQRAYFDEQYDGQGVKERIRNDRNINLDRRLKTILDLKDYFHHEPRLQHGDCRPDHNFSGVFCDLEDFGYYPWYHDVVTYTSNELTSLPVSELPSLLAYYLLYEEAYSSKSSSVTLRELEGLDTTQPENLKLLVHEKIGRRKFADFVAGYLAGAIEEDIIINGVRKKYSPERLQSMVGTHLSPENLHSSRVDHIHSLYAFITSVEAGSLLQNCSNPAGVAEYFYQVGTLLNDLDLIETEQEPGRRIPKLDYLWKLSSGSQFALFFGSSSSPVLPSRERKSA